jgi:hypothetical protein
LIICLALDERDGATAQLETIGLSMLKIIAEVYVTA